MSNTSTSPEITLTSEETAKLAELSTWADSHAATLGANNQWNECATDEDRALFLQSYAPFQTFWQWLQGIADNARRWALWLKALDMLIASILRLVTQNLAGGETETC